MTAPAPGLARYIARCMPISFEGAVPPTTLPSRSTLTISLFGQFAELGASLAYPDKIAVPDARVAAGGVNQFSFIEDFTVGDQGLSCFRRVNFLLSSGVC